ncbi:MAG: peptidylprolyl isomerase [Vicinamibacterales bacterium]
MRSLSRLLVAALVASAAVACAGSPRVPDLANPADPAFSAPAPARARVTLDTTKGPVVIEVIRAWSPLGADRFIALARSGFYDNATIFRIRPGAFAQFGIPADPKVGQAWRHATFPDDPFRESNVRGTIAFAFAEKDGRTTQVFFNLRDNNPAYDVEPFTPFGRVIEGMEIVDAFNDEYGEGVGGIRAGGQDPAFAEGDAFFVREYPRLDRIRRVTVEEQAEE